MRILELANIAVVILATLTMFVLPVKNRMIYYGTMLGIVLLALIHIVIEGFRWQMIPAYLLGSSTLALIIKRGKDPSTFTTKWTRFSYISFLLVWIPITLILPILFPIFNVAHPTGPFQSGRVTYLLEDKERKESLIVDPNELRELKVTIWYPTEENSKDKALYFQDLATIKEVVREKYGIPSFFLSYLGLIKSHSQEEVSVAEHKDGFPAIILSPGLPGTGFMFTSLAEELSSNGYIVTVINHPMNRKVSYGIEQQPSQLQLDIATNIWVQEQQQVIDFLYKINEKNSIFKNNIALDKIGVMGHSLGGATAFQTLITDDRVQAAVNMDGDYVGKAEKKAGTLKPFLHIVAGASHGMEGSSKPLQEKLSHYGGYLATIHGARKASFTDYYLYSPYLPITDKVKHREDEKIISTLLLQFFNKSFYGEKDSIFDDEKNPFLRLKVTKLTE